MRQLANELVFLFVRDRLNILRSHLTFLSEFNTIFKFSALVKHFNNFP